MIEIYLFIHPLCKDCLEAEQNVLSAVQNEDKKVQFRFIPFLNLRSFHFFLQEQNLPTDDIQLRNKLFEATYSASLDYKAVQLQGKKKGREFLLGIQEACCIQNKEYSQELVAELVQATHADLDMFYADRQSAVVKEAFIMDQEIAKEMHVTKSASLVVFNYACDRDFGVLIDNHPSKEDIQELIQTDTYASDFGRQSTNDSLPQIVKQKKNLKLIKN